MKKYVLHPGYVISRTDGQKHYVRVGRLASLYGVSPNECIVVDRERPEPLIGLREKPKNSVVWYKPWTWFSNFKASSSLEHLYPLNSGQYWNQQLREQRW